MNDAPSLIDDFDIRPFVVYEDNHLLAINKPNGMLTQGDETGDLSLVDFARDYIKWKYEKPGAVFLHSINRIDRPASGIVVFCRTSKSLERMNAAQKKHQITKSYIAAVYDQPKKSEGTLVDHLLKNRNNNTVQVVNENTKGAKRAELNYKVIKSRPFDALLDIDLITGRPHQIRVQLSALGHPILGDFKYGYVSDEEQYFIYLHCYYTSFIHPTRKEPIKIFAYPLEYPIWNQYRKAVDFENALFEY